MALNFESFLLFYILMDLLMVFPYSQIPVTERLFSAPSVVSVQFLFFFLLYGYILVRSIKCNKGFMSSKVNILEALARNQTKVQVDFLVIKINYVRCCRLQCFL